VGGVARGSINAWAAEPRAYISREYLEHLKRSGKAKFVASPSGALAAYYFNTIYPTGTASGH
jgi:hypothetical protein